MKLYKKDSKGKIRVEKIWVEGANIIQQSGLLDGKLVTHQSTAKAKNIGRANETTPEQQALLEMESKIKKKLDEGYFKTVKEAENEIVILPMLAHTYDSKKADWSKNVWVQPKLDGMRALAFTGPNARLMSRKGKLIETMPHIIAILKKVPIETVLDGELYIHGETFQENMKAIKKYREGVSENVHLVIYDLIDISDVYSMRKAALETIFETYSYLMTSVRLLATYKIESEQDLIQMHGGFVGQGYEGTIVRLNTAPYELNKRSSSLLKYKDFLDEAFEIVDVIPSDKRPEQGVFLLKKGDQTFRTGMKFSHQEREDFLTNKKEYIGKKAEIRFFELTDDGLPRFPVCVGIRLDK